MTEISAILILLAGGIIGFVICRITMGTKPTAAQQQKLDDSNAELDHYKSQVNNHFTNSAELMQQVASSYQALYTHMAGQSQALLSDSDADALPFPQLKTPPEKIQEELKMTTEAVQKTVAEPTPGVSQTDSTEETKEAVEKEATEETVEDTAPAAVQTDATKETKETAEEEATQEATEDTAPEALQTDATKETKGTAAKEATDDTTPDVADTDSTTETNEDEEKPKNQAT